MDDDIVCAMVKAVEATLEKRKLDRSSEPEITDIVSGTGRHPFLKCCNILRLPLSIYNLLQKGVIQ